jgi:hypothetical protein
MASLNLAGKTSGYVKLQAPDDSSNNPTVTLPTESGELALKSDIGEGGGGSGGGDYTPEPLVWENKKADRALGTVYTNTNDVPLYLYVELTLGGGEAKYVNLYIDGENFGANGTGTTTTSFYNSGLILIPSGSTYELRASSDSGVTMDNWHEARMPVAVGTGGSGGSGWEEKVLFENETGVTNFALSESYDGYDYLRFDTKRTDPAGALSHSDMIPTNLCNQISIDSYSTLHLYLSCPDKINFTGTSSSNLVITKVVGIKTGTGGSGDSAKIKALEARLDKLEKKLKK